MRIRLQYAKNVAPLSVGTFAAQLEPHQLPDNQVLGRVKAQTRAPDIHGLAMRNGTQCLGFINIEVAFQERNELPNGIRIAVDHEIEVQR